jgi:hypothetical protein
MLKGHFTKIIALSMIFLADSEAGSEKQTCNLLEIRKSIWVFKIESNKH